MSTRTVKILLLVFVLLLAIAVLSSLGRLNLGRNESSDIFGFSQINSASVDRFLIKKAGDQKVFSKENGVWKVNGFAASEKSVRDFLDEFTNFKVDKLVSNNPDNHKNFDVADDTAYVIVFENFQKTVLIGKQGPMFGTFYARLEGSPQVYLVSGDLIGKVTRNLSDWRDKNVIKVSEDDLGRIEILQKPPLILTKNKDKWEVESLNRKIIIDDQTVNKFFSALNPLEASDFLDDKEIGEFKKLNKISVNFYDNSGKKLYTMFFAKKNDFYWLSVSGKDDYYKIPLYKMSDILLDYNVLFKK